MRFLNALRIYGPEIFAGTAIFWAVLIVLLDLGGSLFPHDSSTPASREESAAANQHESGCADIGGVKVCN